MIEPRKVQSWSPHRPIGGGQHRRAGCSRVKRGGPGGVREQGERTLGFPRNLGGTVVSASYIQQPAGTGRSIPRLSDARVHRPKRSNQWTEERYRVARETGASGKNDSGQSISIVPAKQGNPPQGSLLREGGCREVAVRRKSGGAMIRGTERCLARRGQGASQQNFSG